MMFYGGGDPIKQMFLDELGNTQYLDQKMIDSEREKYGLNDPFIVQFKNYLFRESFYFFQYNFGNVYNIRIYLKYIIK